MLDHTVESGTAGSLTCSLNCTDQCCCETGPNDIECVDYTCSLRQQTQKGLIRMEGIEDGLTCLPADYLSERFSLL